MDLNVLFDRVVTHDLSLHNTISVFYLVSAVSTLGTIYLGVTYPYGRYIRPGWGLQLNGKVAWFVQEIPSLVIPITFLFTEAPGLKETPNTFFVTLFIVHYIHRACIYPFLIKGGKASSLTVFLIALTFCTVNGYLQTSYLLHNVTYPAHWWRTPNVLLGVPLFVCGMILNIHSDHILRTLRKPGETGYKIPQGGLFSLVSGANFLGEMIEWGGFALATWSLPAFAFWIFTCCSLIPRAIHHHQYYHQKFEDYPKTRKAVIPFIL